ncbi:MAG: hypothetical protein Q8N23_02250 [Archangium sp.]|nr:hypothetical protein [Archangium sp.]MDP3575354.1 hypothetical protein [Archangium sp.]
MSETELVLEIGAEGGGLKVFRRKRGKAWEFSGQLRDQTPTFLNEDDGAGPEIQRDFDWVATLDAALVQLDRYPWAQLYPIAIHPTFRLEVLAAVRQRLKGRQDDERGLRRWENARSTEVRA